MKRSGWSLGICILAMLAVASPPPLAQTEESAEARQAARDKAKEERIQEYLRKKEERRARRASEALRKEEQEAAKKTAEMLAEQAKPAPRPRRTKASATPAEAKPTVAAPVAEPESKKNRKKAKKSVSGSALPRRLAKIHEGLRNAPFAQDETIRPYFELIDAGDASAQQIAAFGNFLGQIGRAEDALAYYDLALDLDDADTTIWLNAGTLQRQIGNFGAAAGAYSEALSVDPNHAYAHYNLGAVLDEMGEYDDAVEEYKIALMLDPSLGDPTVNPQAANNEKLIAVRMLLYKQHSGSLGLPLVTVPNGEVKREK